jgi:hypothetical protein
MTHKTIILPIVLHGSADILVDELKLLEFQDAVVRKSRVRYVGNLGYYIGITRNFMIYIDHSVLLRVV